MSDYSLCELILRSLKARENAYAPYSKFKVGAALLAKSGNIYTGCNFENAAFGAGVCAERVALGNAIAHGETEFEAICVSGKNAKITPCGICRQALYEFGNITVICCDETGEDYRTYELKDLLPYGFDDLD